MESNHAQAGVVLCTGLVSMLCYSGGSRESLNNQGELPLFVTGMMYCRMCHEYSWPWYFINVCGWLLTRKGMTCVFWFLYLWCWNLHWGWLTGLIAVLTFAFEVAEFLLLVMRSRTLIVFYVQSAASAISLQWSSCHFLVIPQALLYAHMRCCVHRFPDKFHVQQSSSQESFYSCYSQFI